MKNYPFSVPKEIAQEFIKKFSEIEFSEINNAYDLGAFLEKKINYKVYFWLCLDILKLAHPIWKKEVKDKGSATMYSEHGSYKDNTIYYQEYEPNEMFCLEEIEKYLSGNSSVDDIDFAYYQSFDNMFGYLARAVYTDQNHEYELGRSAIDSASDYIGLDNLIIFIKWWFKELDSNVNINH